MRERDLALQVAQYLQLQYPGAVYRFDLAADLKLTVGQASRHKRIHPKRGFPDLTILKPTRRFGALFIELKAPGVKVFKADGTLYADPHLAEQEAMMVQLRQAGYWAGFAVGFDEAKSLIDNYLGGKLEPERIITVLPS